MNLINMRLIGSKEEKGWIKMRWFEKKTDWIEKRSIRLKRDGLVLGRDMGWIKMGWICIEGKS